MNSKYNEIVNGFKKIYKNLTVTSVIDYDDTYLLIEAVEDKSKKDYNDPLYAIDKKTGDVSNFSPAFDMDKFFEALENRVIYSSN